MADGHIHALNKRGVEPSREAYVLQPDPESGLCPQAHHLRHPNQLAPKVSFSSPDHRSALQLPATARGSGLGDSPGASVQNGP
jgi:hypothetical protein